MIRVIGQLGNENGEFVEPAGVSIRGNGGLVVADTGNNRLQLFNADGAFVSSLGRRGAELGEFTVPVAAVELSTGRFAIADLGNDRVQLLNFVPRQ